MKRLVYPKKEHEKMMKDYIQETYQNNELYINGDGGCHLYLDYSKWLKKEKQNHLGINLNSNFVPATTYFYIENNQIVGTINIRHCLNDLLLKSGGHIRYSVLPSQRKKGYATKIIGLALKECQNLNIDKVLLVCDKDNIGSAKSIKNNGAILENEIVKDGKTIQRYWIEIK